MKVSLTFLGNLANIEEWSLSIYPVERRKAGNA